MPRKINLCTETVHIDPEAYGTNGIRREYSCVKGVLYVTACRHYSPLVTEDGTTCPYECAHFDNGCKCGKARADAHGRARRILRKAMAWM